MPQSDSPEAIGVGVERGAMKLGTFDDRDSALNKIACYTLNGSPRDTDECGVYYAKLAHMGNGWQRVKGSRTRSRDTVRAPDEADGLDIRVGACELRAGSAQRAEPHNGHPSTFQRKARSTERLAGEIIVSMIGLNSSRMGLARVAFRC
jgi:hypothetical protein